MHSTKAHLRGIITIPCVMITLLVIAFLSKAFGTPPTDPWLVLAYMCVILLGMSVYGAVSSLHKRVSELESRCPGPISKAFT